MATILIASVLLSMPFSIKDTASLSWYEALFTATSAVSVTGLNVVNIYETFTPIGNLILIVLFQIGGIGIMTLGTFIWIILGRNVTLSHRRMIMVDQNRNTLSGLVRLLKLVFIMALIFELAGALIFTVYFYATGYAPTLLRAIYEGVYHAITSFTNAGFDIFGNSMLDFSHDYFVQLVTILLIILGAIGFPVLIEVHEYLFGKQEHFRFSLFTKLTLITYFVLLIVGAVSLWLIEEHLYYADMAWHEKLFQSLFHSVTARSAGFTTMDIDELSAASHFLLSALMFIGASPSSAGGGIRTTTFVLIILTISTYALGRREVRVFKRTIKQEDIIKSLVVFTAAMMLLVVSIIVIDSVELSRFSLHQVIFEVCSAFGTTGLSSGLSAELSPFSQFILMALMFLGRIGMLTVIFYFLPSRRKESFHYPKEDIIIG
jgi:potassium uptake TrkH family protein